MWGYWEGIAARFALVVGEMAGLGDRAGEGLEMGYRGIGALRVFYSPFVAKINDGVAKIEGGNSW